MDQELKQRLIGAVVVTALAAIFIPMLFDDPVDDRSQQVSELPIPATPPANTGAEPVDKAPADADQALAGDNPEEGYVEDANGVEDEPMQPTEGPDVDEEGSFDEAPVPAVKTQQAAGAKAKHGVAEELAVIEDVDQESAEKIDAEVEKLRPKAIVKPAVDNKLTAKPEPKPLTAKKPAAEAAIIKPKSAPVDAQNPKLASPKVAVQAKPVNADAANKPVAPVKPAIAKAKPEAKRWYIQVGSFGKKENAVSLWESLRKDGFPVSLDTIQGEKGTLYRLKIGPELEAKRAADMKARLDKHNVNSILIGE